MSLELLRRHARELALVLLGLIILLIVFVPLRGEVELFIAAALDVALFVILATLAYLAEEKRRPIFRWATIIWLFILIGGLAAATAGMGIMSILPVDTLETGEITPGVAAGTAMLLLGVLVTALISLIGFSRKLRIWLAQYLPLDPDSFVHSVALVMILALILIPLVPLLVTGVPPFLSPLFVEVLTESGGVLADTVTVNAYSLFWTVIASFLIAGVYMRRTIPETLKRLGLVMPTGREVMFAVGAALALVALFYFLDPVLAMVVEYLGLPVTDTDLVNRLFAGSLTVPGIIMASIAAGFGEEISIRGLLQPRFGILLPAFLFASLHAFQYSWDGLISVFIAGVVFAYIRRYSNTTTSAITHTVYDLVLFSMLLVGISI